MKWEARSNIHSLLHIDAGREAEKKVSQLNPENETRSGRKDYCGNWPKSELLRKLFAGAQLFPTPFFQCGCWRGVGLFFCSFWFGGVSSSFGERRRKKKEKRCIRYKLPALYQPRCHLRSLEPSRFLLEITKLDWLEHEERNLASSIVKRDTDFLPREKNEKKVCVRRSLFITPR